MYREKFDRKVKNFSKFKDKIQNFSKLKSRCLFVDRLKTIKNFIRISYLSIFQLRLLVDDLHLLFMIICIIFIIFLIFLHSVVLPTFALAMTFGHFAEVDISCS